MKKSLVFVLAGAVWLTGAAVMAQGPGGGGQQADRKSVV